MGLDPDAIRRTYEATRGLGRTAVRDRLVRQVESGSASSTPPGAKLVAQAATGMEKDLREWRKDVEANAGSSQKAGLEALDDFGALRACSFASMFLVDYLSSSRRAGTTETMARTHLAKALEDERQFMAIQAALPDTYRWAKKSIETGKDGKRHARAFARRHVDRLSPDQHSTLDRLGAEVLAKLLISAAIRSGFVESVKDAVPIKGKRQTRAVLRLAPEVRAWLTDSLSKVPQVLPARLPVAHPPVAWSSEGGGGLWPGLAPQMPFVTGANVKWSREDMASCPAVVDAVNAVQSVAWRLNPFVREAVKTALARGWRDVDLPESVGDEPTPPETQFNPKDPEWSAFLDSRRRWREDEHESFLARTRLARILSVVHLIEREYPEGRFWFVHQVDWRGRVYASTNALSPQGTDLEKSLLLFDKGTPLGPDGLESLFFVAANAWGQGVDKQPIADRKAWGRENLERIMASGEDAGDPFWRDADEPWAFLSIAREIYLAVSSGDPASFESRLPVRVDATCSGMQVLSLALRDEEGARATNCLPGQVPSDLYREVAAKFQQRLEGYATRRGERARWASGFLKFAFKYMYPDGRLGRDLTKKAAMTYVYGAKTHSVQAELSAKYHAKVRHLDLPDGERPFGKRTYPALHWLAYQLLAAVGDVVKRGAEAMRWIQEVADIASDADVHLEWTSPLGFPVRQSYVGRKEKRFIFGSLGGRRAKGTWYDRDETKLEKEASKNGSVPNWVHSLDAAALHMAVLNMRDRTPGDLILTVIHDSFATTAAKLPELQAALRDAYVSVFSGDVLAAFEAEILSALPEGTELPQRPRRGDLNVEVIRDSELLFS